MPILFRANGLLARRRGATPTGTGCSSGEEPWAAERHCRRGCPQRPWPAPRGSLGSSQRPRLGALRRGRRAGSAARPRPLRLRGQCCPYCPQPRWRPRPPRPSAAARGVCRNAGGAGDVARIGPLRLPAAARRCPAASRRSPGRLRGEAAGGAGGGRGRGRWRRGAAAASRERAAGQRQGFCRAPRGTGKAAAGASAWAATNLRESPLPGFRGPAVEPGVGGAGRWRLSLPGRGRGGRPAAVPLRYHRRLSPRPQGSGVPSAAVLLPLLPADSLQKRGKAPGT